MNKLERLIAEHCPKGVEFKPLGEVAQISNGKDHKLLADGQNPVYGSGGIMRYANQHIYDEESVLIPRKGSIGNIFYVDIPFWTVDTIFYTKIDVKQIMPKFLYYFLLTQHLENLNTGGGVPSLTKSVLDKVKIPVPSLAVQKEIVHILDNFTELTAELTMELTARKRQYEYYKNKLLTYGNDVPMVALGEITKVITKGTTPKSFSTTGVNYVKIESFSNGKIIQEKLVYVSEETHTKELKRSILEKDDILFAIAGATIGKCAMVEEKILPANTNQALAILRLNCDINIKYVFYYLQSRKMTEYIAKMNKTSAQPNLNLKQMSDFLVPLPSSSEQSRVVSVLDRFDVLTSDITSGLPAEIEGRRKQYEYYRDRLLTFERKVG
jgi:type I restriction enzyme S subunit